MRLFGRSTSVNVQKVLWALEELGITYDRVDLGGAFGGLDTADYRALNPNRRVPTLIDGDLTLWESNAIVRYLANTYEDGAFAGASAAEVARADMWMEWFQNNCYTHFIALFYQTVRLPKSQRDAEARDTAAFALTQQFETLNTHLAGRKFIAGDQLSMGDFVVGAPLYRYFTMDFVRVNLPDVAAYYARLGEREAYREVVMTSYESLRAPDK